MRRYRSVLIPDGESGQALRVIRCLGQVPNVRINVLSQDKWAPIRASRYHSHFLTHSIDGFDSARLEAIKHAIRTVGADILLPVDLPTIKLVGEHRKELSKIVALPPLPPPKLLDLVSDKWHFSKILAAHGIPYPKTLGPSAEPPDEDKLSHFTFPVLVKPRDLFGGNGFKMCHNKREAIEFLSRQPVRTTYIIQEFINGSDIGCSVLCHNGEIRAHTIQRGLMRAPQPFRPPDAIQFINHDEIFGHIQKLVRAVRWSGVANFDAIYNEETKGSKLLEMNARYWGSLLGSLVAGVNFPHLSCLSAENGAYTPPTYRPVRYARPAVALRLLLKRQRLGDRFLSCMRESGFTFVSRDPLPEVVIQFPRLIFRTIAKLLWRRARLGVPFV